MQHDDQPPTSSRPSLLSAEQQAEAERTLAARTAAPVAPPRSTAKRGKTAFMAAGAVAVLCAGATWWALEDAAQLAAVPVPQATAALTPQAARGPNDPEVSAAAILGENPPPASGLPPSGLPPSGLPPSGFSLKDMLSAPAPGGKGKRIDPDELSKLLEKTPATPVTLASASVEAARAASDAPASADKADAVDKAADKADKADAADKSDKPELAEKAGNELAVLKGAPKAKPNGTPNGGKVRRERIEKNEKAEKAEARLAAARSATAKSAQAKAAQKAPQLSAAKQKSAAQKSAAKPPSREQKAREVKLAATKKPQAKAAPKQASARPEKIDSDVALIAALVTHSQRERTAQETLARAFKECKTQAPAQAEKCKARLCAASAARDALCKNTAIVKTGPDGPLPN